MGLLISWVDIMAKALQSTFEATSLVSTAWWRKAGQARSCKRLSSCRMEQLSARRPNSKIHVLMAGGNEMKDRGFSVPGALSPHIVHLTS